MPSKVIIEFSLVGERMSATKAEIIKDIKEAFSDEEISIPWVNKVEKITLK